MFRVNADSIFFLHTMPTLHFLNNISTSSSLILTAFTFKRFPHWHSYCPVTELPAKIIPKCKSGIEELMFYGGQWKGSNLRIINTTNYESHRVVSSVRLDLSRSLTTSVNIHANKNFWSCWENVPMSMIGVGSRGLIKGQPLGVRAWNVDVIKVTG